MAINFGDMFDNVDRVVDPGFILVYEDGHEGLLRSLTVGQFKQQTNNLARSLLAIGCEPGDKVAIYMRNRLEYLVAVRRQTIWHQWGCFLRDSFLSLASPV
jgi:long-subunit acyl-CoA synthetase (AMP-forming)